MSSHTLVVSPFVSVKKSAGKWWLNLDPTVSVEMTKLHECDRMVNAIQEIKVELLKEKSLTAKIPESIESILPVG